MADSPVTFLLTSVVRGKANRAARWVQPGRIPFVQKLAGGTITVRRARPARITEAALIANIEEIKRAVAAHQLVVTTPSGQVLDLATLELAPAAPSKPLPNPPLDSAKNDKNDIGYQVPPTPEGTTADAPEPELLKRSLLSDPEPLAEPLPDLPPTDLPSAFSHEEYNDSIVEAPSELPSVEAPAETPSVEAEAEESGSDPEPEPEASPSTEPSASKGKKHGKGKRG